MHQTWPVLNIWTRVVKSLDITVRKAVEKCVNRKIKKKCLMVEWWYVAMHKPWLVLNFGAIVVKPLGITVNKSVEKCLNRKIKKICLM
jgi:hypothetical protein